MYITMHRPAKFQHPNQSVRKISFVPYRLFLRAAANSVQLFRSHFLALLKRSSSNTLKTWQDDDVYYDSSSCQVSAFEPVCKENFVPYRLMGFLGAAANSVQLFRSLFLSLLKRSSSNTLETWQDDDVYYDSSSCPSFNIQINL